MFNSQTEAAAQGASGLRIGAVTVVDKAIVKGSEQSSSLGAGQNRLEHTNKNLDTSAENLHASESRIRALDMTKEMMNLTKNQILQEAAQASQGLLQLLRQC